MTMEKRKRGRPKYIPKIDQYCSQPVKETKTVSSVSASLQSSAQDDEVPCTSSSSLKVEGKVSTNSLRNTTDMSSLKENKSNSKTLLKCEVSDDMDESLFMDFRTPVLKKRKIQSKLTFNSKHNCKDGDRKDKGVKRSLAASVVPDKKGTTAPELFDSEGSSCSVDLKCPVMEEASNDTKRDESVLADDSQQKNTSLCPMCWKRFDKVNVAHLKACAAKHNMTTAQLMDAMALQDKQTAEREALGLPAVPSNQTNRRPSVRKIPGASDSNDPNLQLALALSASMQDAEEKQLLQEEEVLIEAGLGQEVVAKQITLLERFGFTSSRPALLTASNPRPRGKHKLKSFPTLLLRTQEDRDRLITEKVALILMGDEGAPSVEEGHVKFSDTSVKSEFLQQFLNEECDLWAKASATPSRLEKSAYYVESLSQFISPSKVEAGSKLKHLSQVPCRLKTPSKELQHSPEIENRTPPDALRNNEKTMSPRVCGTKSPVRSSRKSGSDDVPESVSPKPSPEEQKSRNSPDRSTSHSATNPVKRTESGSGFSDDLGKDWRSILNKSILSDITIYVKNRLKIPAHELVLLVRCPKILDDVIVGQSGNKSIIWINVSFRPALAFLEYIYCGSVNKILSLSEGFEDVQWLTEKYNVINLLKHLEVVTNVRVKLSPNKVSPQIDHHDSEAMSSQSMLTPKYKSPRKRRLSRTPTSSKKRRSKDKRLLRNGKDLNERKRSSSPDPFSESRNNSVGRPSIKEDDSPPDSQANLLCLLELMENTSPVKSQLSIKSDKADSKVNLNDEYSKNNVDTEVGAVNSDCETVILSGSQHSNRSDICDVISHESAANSPDLCKEVGDDFEKLSQIPEKERLSFANKSLVKNEKQHFSDKSPHKKPLEIDESTLPLQRQGMDDDIDDDCYPTCRKIGSSPKRVNAESSRSVRRVLLKSFNKDEPDSAPEWTNEELVVLCDLTQSSDECDHKTNEDLSRKQPQGTTASEFEKCAASGDKCYDEDLTGDRDLSMKLKNCRSCDLSRLSQNSSDEGKSGKKSSPYLTSPASRNPCGDHRNSARKLLVESFITEAANRAQQQDEEEVVFDLTQANDDGDIKALPSPPSENSNLANEGIIRRHSPKRRMSNKFMNNNRMLSSVLDESLDKIKELIENDLDQKTDFCCNESVESSHVEITYISPPHNQQCFDTNSIAGENYNLSRSDEKSENVDIDYQIDCFDYYDSPCKPYVSDPNSSSLCRTKSTSRGKLNLSQNDSYCHQRNSSSKKKALSQSSGSDRYCDVIELDDTLNMGTEDGKSDTPVFCTRSQRSNNCYNLSPRSNKSISSPRKSLESCKRLLDDSFGDRLGNLSVWNGDFVSANQELSDAIACSTPKQRRLTQRTPLHRVKSMDNHSVTPLADYSAMDTPMLKKELQKYGIKPLKRKQAKMILRHIYNELHPLVPAGENAASFAHSSKHFKEPNEDTKVPRSPSKKSKSQHILSPVKSGTRKGIHLRDKLVSDTSEGEFDNSLSSSQSSSVSSSRSDLFAAEDLQDDPVLSQREACSQLTELPDVVRNFILKDPILHQKVLLYDPIWLEQLHQDLKTMNHKFKMDQLMHYLDEQCITFRTSQQPRSTARREARKKKSPKKRSKTVRRSQPEKRKGTGPRKKISSSGLSSCSQSTDITDR